MTYFAEKDLAICGLACVLCSQQDCPGCKARGCKEGSDCSVYKCAKEKNLDGCYQCGEFPCGEDMLKGIRNRAFNRYARMFGKNALLERLRVNCDNGIIYHKPDGLQGDYDVLEIEEDILRLIGFGSHSPYVKCPTLKTERFTLRLVRLEDTDDLFVCYSDPHARKIFNSDNCTSDFCFQTREELQSYIGFWIKAYEEEGFVRYAIIDDAIGRAVGTIEMFGMVGQYKTPQGILRLDICTEYEKTDFLKELLTLCAKDFFLLFGVDQMIAKAVPTAANRIEALTEIGFQPYEITGREHYWMLARA